MFILFLFVNMFSSVTAYCHHDMALSAFSGVEHHSDSRREDIRYFIDVFFVYFLGQARASYQEKVKCTMYPIHKFELITIYQQFRYRDKRSQRCDEVLGNSTNHLPVVIHPPYQCKCEISRKNKILYLNALLCFYLGHQVGNKLKYGHRVRFIKFMISTC